MVKRKSAIVVGGSIGGLLAGNMLVRAGWHVDILERVRDGLSSRGAGIARHPEMGPIMRAAGIAHEDLSGIRVKGRTAYHRDGSVIGFYEYPQLLSAWSRVFDPLHQAFPPAHYHQGKEVSAVEQDSAGVAAVLANGERLTADLLIGADGFRSIVRAAVSPGAVPRYAGYVAWRGMLPERDLSQRFRGDTINRYAFCFPHGSQLIAYPVVGLDAEHPEERQYNFLWYVPVKEGDELNDLLTDESGTTHQFSIPPPLIRSDHIRRLREQAAALLPPQFYEVVAGARRHLVQPIYDVMSGRMSDGRVAILGDAAFVARPHVGVGVLKAGEDAVALATCLAQASTVPEALASYEHQRLGPGRDAVALGRYLGAFIERGLDGPESDPDLDLSPAKVIRISARPASHINERRAYELA
jgi:2-polyprenyl-6-methoxyphenol hydroxylase-like FAD-dependent oxidoreductase